MGIICLVIASLLYGIAPSVQNGLLIGGVTPIALVVACNSFAALIALVLCLALGQSLRVTRKQLLQIALVGGVGMGLTEVLLNAAYQYIPVGFVTMIHFMFPALVCFVTAVFFRERLTALKLSAVVLSVAGLVLLSGGVAGGSSVGVLLALATSVTYSFFLIGNERLSIRALPLMAQTFYINLFTVAVNLFISLFTVNVYPGGPGDWGLCALIGAMFCAAIAAVELGIARLGAGTGSFFSMLEPVVSLIVSGIVFHYTVSRRSVLGCLLILASMLLAALHDRRRERALPPDTRR